MSADERIRAIEREAALSDKGGELLTKELRRAGQAFDACDWCWGHGFRIVCARVERCAFCLKGEPKRSEGKHIADERQQFHTGSTWREISVRAVSRVLERLPNEATEGEARREIRHAYPFGQRKYHPYKIWCDEVKKQLAKRFPPSLPMSLLETKESPQ